MPDHTAAIEPVCQMTVHTHAAPLSPWMMTRVPVSWRQSSLNRTRPMTTAAPGLAPARGSGGAGGAVREAVSRGRRRQRDVRLA